MSNLAKSNVVFDVPFEKKDGRSNVVLTDNGRVCLDCNKPKSWKEFSTHGRCANRACGKEINLNVSGSHKDRAFIDHCLLIIVTKLESSELCFALGATHFLENLKQMRTTI